jgi:hypothetical protein
MHPHSLERIGNSLKMSRGPLLDEVHPSYTSHMPFRSVFDTLLHILTTNLTLSLRSCAFLLEEDGNILIKVGRLL